MYRPAGLVITPATSPFVKDFSSQNETFLDILDIKNGRLDGYGINGTKMVSGVMKTDIPGSLATKRSVVFYRASGHFKKEGILTTKIVAIQHIKRDISS